ncbi:hypothetical protein DPEC_G00292670 [Dallia pectoralis]|uniref:Uncharacterized protein n=1 Tax=Dallia pectoralis TaxID=75939 RepID=A0ACC2FHT1_DALPE|nr:hypothetical protein DPEC_G00292670 [Dallia pectoralis]
MAVRSCWGPRYEWAASQLLARGREGGRALATPCGSETVCSHDDLCGRVLRECSSGDDVHVVRLYSTYGRGRLERRKCPASSGNDPVAE